MAKYLDETGLAHFWGKIIGSTQTYANNLSEYADRGFHATNLLFDTSLADALIGAFPNGFVYQGMTYLNGYYYTIGYVDNSSNTYLFKIDASDFTVDSYYDFGIHIHGNSVNVYNEQVLICNANTGYYLFNTDLTLDKTYSYSTYGSATYRNASFCTFSDENYAISIVSGHAGSLVLYKLIGDIYVSFGIIADNVGAYGYQDMCRVYNLVAVLYGCGNNNRIDLYKYDGSKYKEIMLPSLGSELEGINFDSGNIYVSSIDGNVYSFDINSIIKTSSLNMAQASIPLRKCNEFWHAPALQQGIDFGDYVACTTTSGGTVYVQRNIRRCMDSDSCATPFVWQLNSGGFVAGGNTGSGLIRAQIPIFTQTGTKTNVGLYLAYSTVDSNEDFQTLNTVNVISLDSGRSIAYAGSMASMTESSFIKAMTDVLDAVPTVDTSSTNVFGAMRIANGVQGKPDIGYVYLQ